ncbi:MAG: copper chaperone PCu(A)C [Pseudomonas sp.]
MIKKILMLAALLLPVCFAHALDYTVGALQVVQPWSLELPPNAPTVAAYFVIKNTGKTADRLVSVDSPAAGKAELHQHLHENGLMKMVQVQSVDIAAGGEARFEQMGYHVMLLELKDKSALTDGKSFPLTLHFEKAGDLTVDVAVQKQAPEDAMSHN